MNVKQQHQWIFNEQLSCHNFIYMQRQQQQHSARFEIYMCYMFYCYEAHKPTQVRCTCAHTNISFLISDFVVCSVLPWFRLPMPDRLIRFDFDFVNFIIITLIAFHSFHTNLITKTPKFVPSKAKQIKTKRFRRQMTWMEKVTMKVLISFQNNLRSERANKWQWMSIFSKRDIWLFGYFSLSPSIIYMVYYTILLDFDRTDSINKHTLTTRIPVFSPFFALSSDSISIPIAISIAVRFNALYRCSY